MVNLVNLVNLDKQMLPKKRPNLEKCLYGLIEQIVDWFELIYMIYPVVPIMKMSILVIILK